VVGVIADPAEERIVEEFFELFKIPWESYQAGRRYDVVILDGKANPEGVNAKLVLVYSGAKTPADTRFEVEIDSEQRGSRVSPLGRQFPIYGNAVTLRGGSGVLLHGAGRPIAQIRQIGDRVMARVGYDLFREIGALLSNGQPSEASAVPTLDLHIELLRELITSSGIPLLEIPPAPNGSPFIACLTHDLDHASIRRHKFDPTIWGFLYRATIGSTINVVRKGLPVSRLLTNWAAAVKLPFTYLGLARDIWNDFDRYLDLEKGRPSTFFVIPFENRPGCRSPKGQAPRSRGARYDVSHITGKIARLRAAGAEIGLHGIDAWADTSKGRQEAHRIAELCNTDVAGVRMHWLYSDERSAAALEEANFSYDSTTGYNDTVGYRAGTTQVFKPLNATRLLELPMHIMDTALFYPAYLNLSEKQAWNRVSPILDHAVSCGGVVTINWHDRSIAPERLWGDFYVRLMGELVSRGAHFLTASRAAAWFRKRRSAAFEKTNGNNYKVRVSFAKDQVDDILPGLRLRVHRAKTLDALQQRRAGMPANYTDTAFDGCTHVHLPS